MGSSSAGQPIARFRSRGARTPHFCRGLRIGCYLLWPYPKHDSVFNVEKDFLLLPVVSDECVQSVTVGHPAYEPRVG